MLTNHIGLDSGGGHLPKSLSMKAVPSSNYAHIVLSTTEERVFTLTTISSPQGVPDSAVKSAASGIKHFFHPPLTL